MRLTKKIVKFSNTPKVRVFLAPINGLRQYPFTIDLCIQNIGTGFAYDVKFACDLSHIQPYGSKITLAEYDVIKDGISHLGPGKYYPILLCNYISENDGYTPEPPTDVIDIEVSYRDSENKKYEEKYTLDFSKIDNFPHIDNISLEEIALSLRGVEEIVRSLQGIAQTLSEMSENEKNK